MRTVLLIYLALAMTRGVPHSFGEESWRDNQQNSQQNNEVVKQAAPQPWEAERREGPWEEREGPWEEREGPWEENEGPWEEREGPWEEREGPWEENEGPWEEREGPWEEREGPWEEREGPWEEREGPWEEGEGPWEGREGPWEEREGQWEGRQGRGNKERHLGENEKGHAAWEEREIAFEADIRLKQLKEQRVQLESKTYVQQNIIHGVSTEQDDETNDTEDSTVSARKTMDTASSDLGSTKETAPTTETVTEKMFTDGSI